jgi:chromosome segregation ATPase
MRRYLSLILLPVVFLLSAFPVLAQSTQSAAQTAENLRSQLRDIQTKEAELQSRLHQFDYDLKPENIERYFAGVGSTRPEELRESRRKQLQAEKNSVVAQLQNIADSKVRLEAAISRADAQSYQQSASGATLMVRQVWDGHRVPVLTGVILLVGAIVGLCALVTIRLRKRSS